MLRKRAIGIGLVAISLVTAQSLNNVTMANAQEEEAAEEAGDVAEDNTSEAEPVVAGQMTEQAAAAKRLFDNRKYHDAALAMYKVVTGETGDDPGNMQLGQYYLAQSLYHIGQYHAALGFFSVIAANRNHLKFRETLLWLSNLATNLPEPADVIARVGKYGDAEIKQFDNDKQRPLYNQLNYLLGRYKYRTNEFPEAIRLFGKVTDSKDQYFVPAKFFSGVSNVQARKSVPAVHSFQQVINAVNDGAGGADGARLRDLAYLSMARTFYSASIKLDAETNAPSVNQEKLSEAVKNWNKIDTDSEYWLDALFEESWAYFMAGDFPRTMGNIHTINAPYFPGSFYPEAEILRAIVYFSNCNYEAAMTVVARFQLRYEPIKAELEKVLKQYEGAEKSEEFFKFLLTVRDGKAQLPPSIKGVVEDSLSDRQLLRSIEYVKYLENEAETFKKQPGAFRTATLGQQVQGAIGLFRDQAVAKAADLARARYQRMLDTMDEHVRNGKKILIDITNAQRNQLDAALKESQVSQSDSKLYGIVNPDEEHILWPFDGEYWRDELGFYRQVVESACGR